ncbi:MAG: CYTH domain-containing protein [Chthoniobacterales bacterium]
MGIEIERKFLVKNDTWRSEAVGIDYCQGYLSQKPEATVRVRTEGEKAFLTIKGRSEGISRPEFEYEIPPQEARELQRLCITPLVQKTRYHIPYEGIIWEVDEFHGENEGLIIAEIELDHPEERIPLPPWIGEEVSHDPRYYNSNLAVHPFTKWKIEAVTTR